MPKPGDSNKEKETWKNYFTDQGSPRITEEFYGSFLEKIASRDADELLIEWVERNKTENPVLLSHAISISEEFPEEDRDRVVFYQLFIYEMIRQRTIEIGEKLRTEIEYMDNKDNEPAVLKFQRYKSSRN